jgi:hypothetical protein
MWVAPPKGKMTDKTVYASVERGFTELLKINISLLDWRHVTQAMHQEHLRLENDSFDSELQAGHSVETGSTLYARSNKDLPDFSDREARKFRAFSIAHQHLLGLSLNLATNGVPLSRKRVSQKSSVGSLIGEQKTQDSNPDSDSSLHGVTDNTQGTSEFLLTDG